MAMAAAIEVEATPIEVKKGEVVPADKDKEPKVASAGVRGMLNYADGWDYLASTIAALLFCGFGVTMVSFLFFLKPFFTDISASESSGGGLPMSTVNFMASSLALLAAGQFALVFPAMAVAYVSAARQKRAWQKGVVKSILRQEIGWFDVSKPEELTSKVSSSVALIVRGLEGPSYGLFIAVGGVCTGMIGGFLENYEISLVVLAMVPVLAMAIAILVYTMVTGSRDQSKAYGTAGGYASEALFAMRTIAALGLESEFVKKYSENLATARKVTIGGRAKLGFATGLLFSSFILLQGVGFMYGGLTFSAEMKRSEYDYKMNRSVPVPGMPGVMTTVEMHWCAHANNTPANVSINAPCEAPLKPLRMNCQLANLFSMFDGDGTGAFNTNMSMLQIIGQDSWDGLRNYSADNAPDYEKEVRRGVPA
jgi:ABC-type multidrug transport system fused ATPase/permease subunit